MKKKRRIEAEAEGEGGRKGKKGWNNLHESTIFHTFANAKLVEIIQIMIKNMKKKGTFIAGILFISLLGGTIITSCDKDTRCGLKVKVVDPNTGAGVAGAQVNVNVKGGTIDTSGVTQADGIFATSFAAPAVFDIQAQLVIIDTEAYDPNQYFCHRDGTSSIRLKEGKTVDATVYLSADTIVDRR